MGAVFAREVMGVANPSIGQLNIGGEAKKGTRVNVETHEQLARSDEWRVVKITAGSERTS